MSALHGWGRYPVVDAAVMMPRSRTALRQEVLRHAHSGTLIARGLGRSYGDSSLSDHVLATIALDHLIDFDGSTGRVACSAGVTLGDLLGTFVPRGWFLPVTPGTQFVTVGGAVASDVHGKNHHVDGCFSEFVDALELMIADGTVVTCSRAEHADLFHATCGGMGLTGVIVAATLRLRRIGSAYIRQTTYKTRDLAEVVDLMTRHRAATYSVAWVDCLATEGVLGRSVLMLGEHEVEGPLEVMARHGNLSVPIDMPGRLLQPRSVRLFNTAYYHRIREPRSQRRVHYAPYFYPLDGLRDWNRLYGRQGLLQHQFALPHDGGSEGLRAILHRIAQSGRASFLSVLKLFGPANRNHLSFPLEGLTLALDLKAEAGVFELLDELDAMVLDHGGRLYLAKDARMSESTFKRSYPRWEEFNEVRAHYGALGVFVSHQSRRIGLDS